MLTCVRLVSENVFGKPGRAVALLLREDSRRSGSRWSENVAYSQYCFVLIFFLPCAFITLKKKKALRFQKIKNRAPDRSQCF